MRLHDCIFGSLILLLGWLPSALLLLTRIKHSSMESGLREVSDTYGLPRSGLTDFRSRYPQSEHRERYVVAVAPPYMDNTADILLETAAPLSVIDPQFLSVTLGAGDVSRDWRRIAFTSLRIVNMARALHPAMLRLGGTSGDYLLFNDTHYNEPEISRGV